MKKSLLKIISVFLALTICMSLAVPSFAILEEYDGRTCPRIYVHGFMAYDIYKNPENVDEGMAYPIPSEKINSAIEKAKEPIKDFIFKRDYEKFGDAAADIVDSVFEDIVCDYSGNSLSGSAVVTDYPKPEDVKSDSAVIFGYDWRLDPLESAKELDKFIDYMLLHSGCEKVVIDCHSLGSVIVFAYLRLYGTEKVKSVVFNTAGLYGQTYTGELLSGNVVVNKDAIKNYLDFAFDGTPQEKVLKDLIDTADKLGVISGVCGFADNLLDKIYDRVALNIVSIFGNWTTIWAMVPDDMLSDAESYVFGLYDDAGIDYTGLKQKIDTYNELVRKNKTEALVEISKTVNIYVLARYGYSAFPLTDSWQIVGDGVIDTKYNSFGATIAAYKEQLDVSESAYISPDKSIDASTCLFPEQTWFIKELKHYNTPNDVDRLIDELLYFDGKATVDTFEEYPRFLKYDAVSDTLIIDDGTTEKDGVNFIFAAVLVVLILILLGIILLIIKIVKKFKIKKEKAFDETEKEESLIS